MRWGEKRYHSLDYELKQMFKEKVYKIALNGGMTVQTVTVMSEQGAASSAVPRVPAILPALPDFPSPNR